jgi:hypothetical protein
MHDISRSLNGVWQGGELRRDPTVGDQLKAIKIVHEQFLSR